MTNVSLEEMIKVGAHFGHQTRRWNPKMEEYLHGSQNNVHIFDLIKTKETLDEALGVITKMAKEGKTILLLGTKKQAKDKVQEVAKEAGIYYVNERWLGGTITNFDQIKRSCKKLTDMRKGKAAGEFNKFTKKERLLIDREITRLERFFGGIEEMASIPELLLIVDIKREAGAIKEAKMAGIPMIAIVDSNCDPGQVDYPITMNDDATQALSYVLGLFRDAVLEGKNPPAITKKVKVAKNDDKTKKTVKKTKKSEKK